MRRHRESHRGSEQPSVYSGLNDAPSPRAALSEGSLPLSAAPQTWRLVWGLVSATVALALGLWTHLLGIVYERQGAAWGRLHLLFGCLIAYQVCANQSFFRPF